MKDETAMLKQLQTLYAQDADNVQDMGFSQQVVRHIQQKQRRRRGYWLAALTSAVSITLLAGYWLISPLLIIDIAVLSHSVVALGLLLTVGLCLCIFALE